jgi:bla regulator protein blaR1
MNRQTMRRLVLLSGPAVAVSVAVLSVPRPLAQSFAAPAGTVSAPDPNVPLFFEAASVKPSNATIPGMGIRRQPGGRFNTVNTPLKLLITFAYQIQDFQLVGGPGWMNSDRFDIVAKMEGDPPPIIPGSGADHMMLAMRSLLADRFKLVVHRETRQLDIYALTMTKPGGPPGPALKPASGDCSPAAFAARRGGPPPTGGPPPVVCGMQQGPGRIRFGGFPLSLFATGISNRVGRAVVDRTGLTGNWDFELSFAAEVPPGALPPGEQPPRADPDAPDLFTAVREQLGLKLESTKGPVEVLVIDSVQQPTPD